MGMWAKRVGCPRSRSRRSKLYRAPGSGQHVAIAVVVPPRPYVREEISYQTHRASHPFYRSVHRAPGIEVQPCLHLDGSHERNDTEPGEDDAQIVGKFVEEDEAPPTLRVRASSISGKTSSKADFPQSRSWWP